MGFHDRDYNQDDYGSPKGVSTGPRMMVTKLVILNASIFLLELLLTREGSKPGSKIYWFCDILVAEPGTERRSVLSAELPGVTIDADNDKVAAGVD